MKNTTQSRNLLFVLFILSVPSFNLLAQQNTGTVIFTVQPEKAVVKINEQLYNLQDNRKVELAPGTYPIEIWAPKMAVHKDTITVVENETLQFKKGLIQPSADFENFRKEKEKYFYRKALGYATDVAVVSANATMTYLVLRKSDSFTTAEENAYKYKMEYEELAITSQELNDAKSEFEKYRQEYEDERKKYNNKITVGIPLLAVSYGLSTYYFIKRSKKKRTKPVYNEKNPLVNNMILSPEVHYATQSYGLRINLTF